MRSKAGEFAKLAGAEEQWTATQRQKNTAIRRRFFTPLDSKIRFAFRVMPVPIIINLRDGNYEFNPPLNAARRRRNVKKPKLVSAQAACRRAYREAGANSIHAWLGGSLSETNTQRKRHINFRADSASRRRENAALFRPVADSQFQAASAYQKLASY